MGHPTPSSADASLCFCQCKPQQLQSLFFQFNSNANITLTFAVAIQKSGTHDGVPGELFGIGNLFKMTSQRIETVERLNTKQPQESYRIEEVDPAELGNPPIMCLHFKGLHFTKHSLNKQYHFSRDSELFMTYRLYV